MFQECLHQQCFADLSSADTSIWSQGCQEDEAAVLIMTSHDLSADIRDISMETGCRGDQEDIALCISDAVGRALPLASDCDSRLPDPLTLSMLDGPQTPQPAAGAGLAAFSTQRSADSGISSMHPPHTHRSRTQRRVLLKKLKQIGRRIHQEGCFSQDLHTLAVL